MSVLVSRRPAAFRSGFVRYVVALAGVALLAAASGAARAWEAGTDGLPPIPPLAARVTDLTRTLDAADAAALEAKLADWEARTSNQLVVLIVPSTQPEPIESYALRVAEKWRIGRKGQDNGALLVVAKNDRKLRIEVGYGLEGTLTDVTSSRIIREDIAPRFREDRYAAGINAGVDRIIAVVAEGKPLPPPKAATAGPSERGGPDLHELLAFLFFGVVGGAAVLRRIFGRVVGSTVGAGIFGAVAWFVAGSIAIAVVAAILGFVMLIVVMSGSGVVWSGGTSGGGGPGGGGWGGGSSGGGFSGGGGSFGGGGASGNW